MGALAGHGWQIAVATRSFRRLPGRFFRADEGNFNALAAVRAGDIDDQRPAHDALRHGGDHRVDIVESPVERVHPVLDFLDGGIVASPFVIAAVFGRFFGSPSQYQDNLQKMLKTL
jgi:hypothetical protein